jgi:hypothetical protein
MLGLKIHSEVLFDFEVRGRRDLVVELVVLCTSASKQELGKIGKCDLIRDHLEGEEDGGQRGGTRLLGRPTAGTGSVISGICMPSPPCSWTFACVASQHEVPTAGELTGGRGCRKARAEEERCGSWICDGSLPGYPDSWKHLF